MRSPPPTATAIGEAIATAREGAYGQARLHTGFDVSVRVMRWIFALVVLGCGQVESSPPDGPGDATPGPPWPVHDDVGRMLSIRGDADSVAHRRAELRGRRARREPGDHRQR